MTGTFINDKDRNEKYMTVEDLVPIVRSEMFKLKQHYHLSFHDAEDLEQSIWLEMVQARISRGDEGLARRKIQTFAAGYMRYTISKNGITDCYDFKDPAAEVSFEKMYSSNDTEIEYEMVEDLEGIWQVTKDLADKVFFLIYVCEASGLPSHIVNVWKRKYRETLESFREGCYESFKSLPKNDRLDDEKIAQVVYGYSGRNSASYIARVKIFGKNFEAVTGMAPGRRRTGTRVRA